jgi:SAM-dependent methyltransferase
MPASAHQRRLGNNWERAVFAAGEYIDPAMWPREVARYQWAAAQIQPGQSVLEVGCSSGWGTTFFPKDIQYLGVDADAAVTEFAREQFGDDQHQFIWSTVNAFLDTLGGRTFDVVLAMEVLEHIPNGRELAQRLKQAGRLVLVTAPYRESVGFWGPHHVLHGLREHDFPGFAYQFLHGLDTIDSRPTMEPNNLMLMAWKAGETYPNKERILCAIPTRDRYDSLMQCLQSVAFQTTVPDKVVIYDDTPESQRLDLRTHALGQYLLPLLTAKGIEWEVVFTPGLGQHIAHQWANESGYDLVWRLDDDCVAELDVLGRLLAHMRPGVGAVGGAVYELGKVVTGTVTKMTDFFSGPNTQWAPDQGLFDVEFIYSSFLYRSGLVDYKHTMSPAAFHEETIFTHRLFRAGYRLIVDTSIHTHHFKAASGGTRYTDLKWAYAWDQMEFIKILEHEFGIKLIEIGVGLGDNYAFLNVVPELVHRWPHLIIATCYPEVYEGCGATVVPYQMAGTVVQNDNVYDWMSERNWSGSMIDAFRSMYL